MVPSHCFLAAILTSFSFMATNGQSAAVAAQYMLSGQQNQFCSGQHPAGHTVPSHCFLAAILTSFSFMATNGQSAAVAAQYMLSGQQNQFCSGQHPAGHTVPSHCFLAAILTSFSSRVASSSLWSSSRQLPTVFSGTFSSCSGTWLSLELFCLSSLSLGSRGSPCSLESPAWERTNQKCTCSLLVGSSSCSCS